MKIQTLSRKAGDAVKAGMGICLTPVAVLGVASVALAVFVMDRFDRMSRATISRQRRRAVETN